MKKGDRGERKDDGWETDKEAKIGKWNKAIHKKSPESGESRMKACHCQYWNVS